MILFSSSEFESIATGLRGRVPQLRRGQYRTSRFDNGELRVDVDTPVRGERCLVLGTIAPPDTRLTSTLLLAHTLRKEGAREVIGVLPYLAYSRQDKNKPGESLAAAWIGTVMRASGFDRLITIDVHSAEDQRLLALPLCSLSPAGIFADALRANGLEQATIIAPDEGAVARCEATRAAAGLSKESIPHFEKRRTDSGIHHSRFAGEVGAHAVLIDDILDTGATLISASQRLLCAGVEDIQIMVTHGLFKGDEWAGLWELGISRIFCTDTVPLRTGVDRERVVILSVLPLLAGAVADVVETRQEGLDFTGSYEPG